MIAVSERMSAGPRLAAITVTALGFVAVVVWGVRSTGFLAVSDDDFCRITIAQRFAVDPHLDPSGTSWLPLPFWLLGSWFALAGRSLAAAAIAAPLLTTLGLVPWLWAQRDRDRHPRIALTLVLAVDWVAWLAATPVPEALVAGLVSAPFLADDDDGPWPYAIGLLCATLARYEAWPLALLWAAMVIAKRGRHGLAPATVALAGSAAWLLWNRYAHGDALHFLARVRRYAASHGHPQTAVEALAVYPRALVTDGRPLAILGLLALVVTLGAGDAVMRRRAARASAAALALFGFLELGALRSGVPTHHAVRALVPLAFLAAPLIADALATRGKALAPAIVPLATLLVASTGHWSAPPGTGADDRTYALELGAAAARRSVTELTIARCGFEHFATIAAFGAPERVRVEEQQPGRPCPEIVEANGVTPGARP